jgi:hypothetical protein
VLVTDLPDDIRRLQVWSEEHILTFNLHVVIKYVAGDLIVDYQPLYNNPQFKEALMNLLNDYGFPEQELERAGLGLQGCPPIVFKGVASE